MSKKTLLITLGISDGILAIIYICLNAFTDGKEDYYVMENKYRTQSTIEDVSSIRPPSASAARNATHNADRYDEEQAWMYGIWTVIDDFSDYQNYRDSETGEIMGMGFIETQTISIVPGEYISIYHSNPGEIVEWSKQKFLGANPSYARW